MFPDISFRDWHRRRSNQADLNLVSSSLNRPGGRSGEIVPAHLRELPRPHDGPNVRDLLADEYGVPPRNIAVTGRCQHANFLVAAAVRDLADEAGRTDDLRVLVETPAYQPLGLTPEGFGFTIDRFERRPSDHYAIDPARIGDAMTHDTALVIVTNRHNPSGHLSSYETLEELARIVRGYDAYLLVDEVFSPFVYETPAVPQTAFGGMTTALLPNTVVTNSLTKFHGLYDVNVGWVVADERFVERVRRIEEHTNVVARPNREMARRALAHPEHFREASREMLREKNDLLATFVAGCDDVAGFVADDHVFAFLDHEHVSGDAMDEAAISEGVWLFPGRFFGDPDRFRISLGYGMDECRDGLERLGDALDSL